MPIYRERERGKERRGKGKKKMIKQLWQSINLGQANRGILYSKLATFL